MLKEDTVKGMKINSLPVELIKENDYIMIKRIFNDDKIETEINAALHLIPLQGDEDSVAAMFGNVLLAQIGPTRTLKGVSNHTINQLFIHSEKDKLEFSVDDGKGKEIKFIPLFRVEEEYTVYFDRSGNSLQDNFFFRIGW